MLSYSPKNNRKNITKISLILSIVLLIFPLKANAETTVNRSHIESEDLSGLQRDARVYRNRGLELQARGNLDEAMALYQKAVELDPAYVIAYNDLGVIYEAKGLPQRAEASYLRSIKIDPNYLSAYSNLALLYENRGDFDKASFYWSKRIELGSPDDSWTGKARQHLEYISLILGRANTAEVSDLSQKVIAQKALLVGDDKELAKVFLQRAEQSFKKQDYAAALKQAIDAMQLDPSNREIRSFVDKAQLRLLSR